MFMNEFLQTTNRGEMQEVGRKCAETRSRPEWVCRKEPRKWEKTKKKMKRWVDGHTHTHTEFFLSFVISNYSQQDATFIYLFIFTDAVHVSGCFFTHHQEHTTVHTASGIVNQYCC
jgi:hypothetical protein